MVPFCGFDRCSLDSNGRIKLSPAAIADFGGCGTGLVLRRLPEGAIGVYPEEVFLKMRHSEAENMLPVAASSSMFRRNLRVLNAMSRPGSISPQGRITIPADFRTHAGMDENPDLVIVGVEIGLEIWSAERWAEEEKKIEAHLAEKDTLEMRADLDQLTMGKEDKA